MNDCNSAQPGVRPRAHRERQGSFGDMMGSNLSNVRYGMPPSIQGVNTFILWTEGGRIKMKFESVKPGPDNILHIITTAAEFRKALLKHGITGSEVQVYQEDGSVFVYTYHELER